MRIQRYYRSLTFGLCVVVAAAAAIAMRPPTAADGPLLDLLVWLRSIETPERETASSPVAVIALDRRSLDAPEVARYPRTLLEPLLATALTAVLHAGARAAGFDEILAYDPAMLPGFDPGFDHSFLAALHENHSRIALARSLQTPPAPPFAFSAGNDAIGVAEVSPDPDGIYRRVPAWVSITGGREPSFVNVLLGRAGMMMPATVLLVPRRHLERIPTYALIDVLRCAQRSPSALADAFGGKIVLIGGTLPEEDRRQTSGRWLAPAVDDSPPLKACGLRMLGASNPGSQTVPGVFLHAAVAEAVASGNIVRTAPTLTVTLVASCLAAIGAATALLLAPWTTGAIVAATAAVVLASAAAVLNFNWWIPIAIPLGALGAAPVFSYVVRYLTEERTRRRIVHAFNHYLSPAIVEQLAAEPAALKLGGERREITVMFADLSGFTAMSGKVLAEVLTATVNRYLSCVVNEVESSGGYVDKFIGDAVMAIWGAPVGSPHHAVDAVHCAMRSATAVAQAQRADQARGEAGFSIKIGLNSGPAVVGNVGTEHRYNYTAVGETVNLASRLEGVPGIYQCAVVIGPRTAELVREEFMLMELDLVLVKGARAPMPIYQPICERRAMTAGQIARATRYGEALAQYRAGCFEEAASIWEELSVASAGGLAAQDAKFGPEAVMAHRARELIASPPAGTWNAVNVLTTK